MSQVDYNKLINIMMYMVIRDALIIISQNEPSSSAVHIRISFLTNANDVVIPDYLKKVYPDKMPIVLQHQFDDLKVDNCHFSIVLSFNSKKEKIIVPFSSITEYIDVNSGFSMNFNKSQSALSHEVQTFLSQNHFSTTQIKNKLNTIEPEVPTTSHDNQIKDNTNNIIYINEFFKGS